MDAPNQCSPLSHAVDAVVERFRHEYDMSYASAVAVLLMLATRYTFTILHHDAIGCSESEHHFAVAVTDCVVLHCKGLTPLMTAGILTMKAHCLMREAERAGGRS